MGVYKQIKFKSLPSGKVSVLATSCVPVGGGNEGSRTEEFLSRHPRLVAFCRAFVAAFLPPCQSCQTSASDSAEVNHGTMDKNPTEGRSMDGVPGKGGLGNKKAMSFRSARNLYERACAIEREYGRGKCWFLTLTQPSVDFRAYEGLARYSSYAMDRLNRELKRFFVGDFARVSVWEYQKRGSLHVHMIIGSHCMDASEIDEFREYIGKVWYRTLGAISRKFNSHPYLGKNGKHRTFDDLMDINKGRHFVNCQVVKKTVAGYLAKYLGGSNHKGGGKNKNSLRKSFFPIATWTQWDKKATELYEKYCQDIDLGQCYIDMWETIKKIIYKYASEIKTAPNTEIKHPKNPYVEGVYVIPEDCKDKNFEKLTEEMIVNVRKFTTEKLPKFWDSKKDKEDDEKEFVPECYDTENPLDMFVYRKAEIEKEKALIPTIVLCKIVSSIKLLIANFGTKPYIKKVRFVKQLELNYE